MLNQAQLIGYTGAEPEIRTTTSGKQVATLRVCTSRYSKAKGERKDYPTWHQVEIWTPATVNWLATKGLPTGARVFVQGEIRHDRYTDKDGVERFFSKVVVTAPGQTLTALDRPEPTLADPA
ncbi:single-stranded DNA-binding protein [Phenylobacterium montanum]|uniref:Single-stranded DNA-binding protein n=1 Tax=Phenylobacterium montanum TaxID=2823693 RepID=A0A975IXS8_9CAUL|nr:single-stranded DNA-binding protein [Caulobacter sp. S6]QUD90944.1 single-stranded DNA-binding protein [Caulobacter sp. S6]